MKALIAFAAAALTAFTAVGATSATPAPDGRWGVMPQPRSWAGPGAMELILPSPRGFGRARPAARPHGAIGRW